MNQDNNNAGPDPRKLNPEHYKLQAQGHPRTVVQNRLTGLNIDAMALLVYLLEVLQQCHMISNLTRDKADASSRSNVFNEIINEMQSAGRNQTDPPKSILDTIDMILQTRLWGHEQNLAGLKAANLPDPGRLEIRVTAERTMRLVLRDLMNSAETQALNTSIIADEMMKRLNEGIEGDKQDPPAAEEPA